MQERTCKQCTYRLETECRNPQAIHIWGSLNGMKTVLPDRGWPRWPKADSWCGFWKPTEEWLSAVKPPPASRLRAFMRGKA